MEKLNYKNMDRILIFIKKIIPRKVFLFFQPMYHFALGFLAALRYGFPGNKLLVVGVTGTTGKTTSVYLTAKMLQKAGVKVGWTSTALLSDGEKEWLNDKKMTMLGRFFTQKMLRKMVRNGCEIAIIETTSEGIRQFRHRFINYDVAVFTGIYPEHIESHGSFENYKKEKLKLFRHLEKCRKKDLQFANYDLRDFKKAIIVNLDDKFAGEFLDFAVERKIGFFDEKQRTKNNEQQTVSKEQRAMNNTREVESGNLDLGGVERVAYQFLEMNDAGTKFVFDGVDVQLKILGEFNAVNATIAGCVGKALGISNEEIKRGLESVKNIPGRLEKINEGQNFTIIVDYAFEPKALGKLYDTVLPTKSGKIIHILGSAGGGRDVARRRPLGKIAGKNADVVIVTNEDPYDDDPMEIIEDVADGVKEMRKKVGENLFLIEDRREAIEKAINMATEGDIVLITGKGSEQAIVAKNGKLIPWDDRKVVREILKKM